MVRSGPWPCRTNRARPSSSRRSAITGQEGFGFRLDRLGQQAARSRAQDCGQRIIDHLGLPETDNGAILVHGVSLSWRGSGRLVTRLDTPPSSDRRHPASAIAPGSGQLYLFPGSRLRLRGDAANQTSPVRASSSQVVASPRLTGPTTVLGYTAQRRSLRRTRHRGRPHRANNMRLPEEERDPAGPPGGHTNLAGDGEGRRMWNPGGLPGACATVTHMDLMRAAENQN